MGYHLSRYPSFNEPPLSKDFFFNHTSSQASSQASSSGAHCSLPPYGSALRSVSAYVSDSDPVHSEPGLDQTAAHIMDSSEGFGFEAGLNPQGGQCQGQTYSAAAHSGYYGNGTYMDSQRMTSLVDQHVSVISSVSSLRPFAATFSEVHDPLNLLGETMRKSNTAFYSEAEPTADPSLSSSTPCMFGIASPFSSQDAMMSQQRVTPSASEVHDLVSSLPPINTVFMGAGGVQ